MAIFKDRLDVRKLNKYNILYVDDEDINLKVFKETFRRDYNVYTATSGKEALQMIDDHKEIDLVITDQRMPEMTGTELLEKVVLKNPGILRMIMTGHSDLEVIVKAVNEYGIDQYITKPWNSDSLKDTLDNLLAKYSKESIKTGGTKSSNGQEEDKVAGYAQTLVNINEVRVDLIRKHFPMPLVINYSRDSEGKENMLVFETEDEKSMLALMINCSVSETPGSMIKSFLLGYGKGYLLENKDCTAAAFYEYMVTAARDFSKNHFHDNIKIGITVFSHVDGRKEDEIITNTHMLYGYKNDQPMDMETVVGSNEEVKSDDSKVYYIGEDQCDKLYIYAIDTLIDKDIFEGNLLIKLQEGQEMSYGELIISLQAFLNSSVSTSGVDKFSLIGLDYTIE